MSTITLDRPAIAMTRTTYRSSTARPAPVRLTLRGRVLLVSVALAVIAAAAVVFGAAVVATDEAPMPGTVETVTVQPGQTLWSIAAEARPDADIRETVDQIIRLNALEDGAPLPIGATLAVPARD